MERCFKKNKALRKLCSSLFSESKYKMLMNSVINEKYKLDLRVGGGSFGDVYIGKQNYHLS